jgi:hypothetical protein
MAWTLSEWQRFHQISAAAIARAERKNFSGSIECRVCFRNSVAKRGTVRSISRKVLSRIPRDAKSFTFPADAIEDLMKDLPRDNRPNEDSEISVTYTFFAGSVVDFISEVVQHV